MKTFGNYRKLSLLFCASVLGLSACSNSTPSLVQQTAPPQVASKGITIKHLDAAANVTGTCDDIGKMDRGFEIQIAGTWKPAPQVECVNGAFSIRVERLGRELQFNEFVRATKSVRVRRSAITGKATEVDVAVTYAPNLVPGGLADGGGIGTGPGYILRGSFSGPQKEKVLTSSKFRAVLSRDQL